MLWTLPVLEWAGAIAVLAFSLRRTALERTASFVLLITLFVGTLTSIAFSTYGQATASDYWANADTRAFCAMIEDALCASVFWGLAHRAKWAGWLGSAFFAQETVYLVYVCSGHTYFVLQAAERLTFLLFVAQLAIVSVAPRWPQIVGAYCAWRDDRRAVVGERGFRRVRIRPSPYLKERFPGEGK